MAICVRLGGLPLAIDQATARLSICFDHFFPRFCTSVDILSTSDWYRSPIDTNIAKQMLGCIPLEQSSVISGQLSVALKD
jgi:hypothetical protein